MTSSFRFLRLLVRLFVGPPFFCALETEPRRGVRPELGGPLFAAEDRGLNSKLGRESKREGGARPAGADARGRTDVPLAACGFGVIARDAAENSSSISESCLPTMTPVCGTSAEAR